MAVLVVVGAWLMLAPVAALAVSAALRVADRTERSTTEDAELACPPDAECAPEPVGAAASRA
jgi:hypothetical protein